MKEKVGLFNVFDGKNIKLLGLFWELYKFMINKIYKKKCSYNQDFKRNLP